MKKEQLSILLETLKGQTISGIDQNNKPFKGKIISLLYVSDDEYLLLETLKTKDISTRRILLLTEIKELSYDVRI